MAAIERVLHPPTGTIHCSSVNAEGRDVGCDDHQRAGLEDSRHGRATRPSSAPAATPIRMWVRRARPATAKRTSRSAARTPSSRTCGMACLRRDAGMDALKRIVRNYNGDMQKLQYVDMSYYILRKDGAYAGVCMWSGPPTSAALRRHRRKASATKMRSRCSRANRWAGRRCRAGNISRRSRSANRKSRSFLAPAVIKLPGEVYFLRRSLPAKPSSPVLRRTIVPGSGVPTLVLA